MHKADNNHPKGKGRLEMIAGGEGGGGVKWEDQHFDKKLCILPMVDLPRIARTIATHILRLNMKLEKLKK